MARLILPLAALGCKAEGPLTYATVDGVELTLDVWQPEGEGPHPGVLILHGGGWKYGDLYGGGLDDQAADAAQAGFVAVSANYRLSTQATWPAQREDVGCALRWMRAHAEDYDLDPERIAAVGHSAGGHLSLILAEDAESVPPDWCAWSDQDGTLQAAVSLAGPAHLPLCWEHSADWGQKMINELLGLPRDATPETDLDAYLEASPLTYVGPDGPPVLQVAGTRDELVPPLQAEPFDVALAQAGRPHELRILEGYAHNELNLLDEWLPYLEERLGL